MAAGRAEYVGRECLFYYSTPRRCRVTCPTIEDLYEHVSREHFHQIDTNSGTLSKPVFWHDFNRQNMKKRVMFFVNDELFVFCAEVNERKVLLNNVTIKCF